MKKSPYVDKSITNGRYNIIDNEFNYRVNLKTEDILTNKSPEVSELLTNWKSLNKLFRYKKRYSYITSNSLFRIDLTIVKTNIWNNEFKSYNLSKSFKDSNVLNNPEAYELEIEYIGNQLPGNMPSISFMPSIHNKTTIKHYLNKSIILREKGPTMYDPLKLEQEGILKNEYNQYTYDINSDIIGKYCTINQSYWDKNDKGTLYDALSKNKSKLYILDLYKDYDGENGKGNYVYVQLLPELELDKDIITHLFIPVIDISISFNYIESKSIDIPDTFEPEYTIFEGGGKDVYNDQQREIIDIILSKIDDQSINDKYSEIFEWYLLDEYDKEMSITEEEHKKFKDVFSKYINVPLSERFSIFKKYMETEDTKQKSINYFEYEQIPVPDELKGITFIKEQWVPTIETILKQLPYKMRERPKPNTVDMYQYQMLKAFISKNNIIEIPKDISKIYKLGNIKSISPYIQYNKHIKSYIIKYSVIEVDDEISDEDISLDILFDINIEYIHPIVKELDSLITSIYKVLRGCDILLSKTDTNEVIEQYRILTNQTKKYTKYIGPQPVTLSMKHLDINNPTSIINNYMVTDKADGYRYALFIEPIFKIGYLINSKMHVISTGMKFPSVNGGWILDGEYITNDKNNNKIKLFKIFDVYFAKNEYDNEPYTYPFVSVDEISRMSILSDFKNHLKEAIIEKGINEDSTFNSISIQLKEYEKGLLSIVDNSSSMNDKIFTKSKNILNRSSTFNYNIDGLIYLPSNLPVKAQINGLYDNNISGTWNLNYKWKPPEENTIDFKVKIKTYKDGKNMNDEIIPIVMNDKVIKCKKLILYVMYDEKKDNELNFCKYSLINRPYSRKNEIVFNPKNTNNKYSSTYVKLDGNKLLCIKDKNTINNNDIIEMRFNKHATNGLHWEPLRVRSDKQKPQFFKDSYDIWDSINNEVSEDMIKGSIDYRSITSKIKSENYYESELLITTSQPLRSFHNFVKSELITYVASKNKENRILDTSIGRGGDLNKYLDPGVNAKLLVGLDLYPVNEACRRLYFMNERKIPSILLRFDTSNNIISHSELVGTSEEKEHTNTLLNILYDTAINKRSKDYKDYKMFKGLCTKKFNLISSQFSLHYYFKSESILRGFINNLSENCVKGGYFIGTCYDGLKLFNLLKEVNTFNYIDNIGNTVFEIEKKYDIDSFDYNKPDISNMINQKISVYMDSIGNSIDEYLVNFRFFTDIMNEYGFIVPDDINSDLLKGGINSFETILAIINENPKKYESHTILNDDKLTALSSINNYFIFQKI